jgi:hypothetical protein
MLLQDVELRARREDEQGDSRKGESAHGLLHREHSNSARECGILQTAARTPGKAPIRRFSVAVAPHRRLCREGLAHRLRLEFRVLPLKFLVENSVRVRRQRLRAAPVTDAHLNLDIAVDVPFVAPLPETYAAKAPFYLPSMAEFAACRLFLGCQPRLPERFWRTIAWGISEKCELVHTRDGSAGYAHIREADKFPACR